MAFTGCGFTFGRQERGSALGTAVCKIQWNPTIMDTIGNQNVVCYSEMSLTQGLLGYSGRHGMHNWAVDHNMAVFFSELFLCCTLAGNTMQRLVLQVTVLI